MRSYLQGRLSEEKFFIGFSTSTNLFFFANDSITVMIIMKPEMKQRLLDKIHTERRACIQTHGPIGSGTGCTQQARMGDKDTGKEAGNNYREAFRWTTNQQQKSAGASKSKRSLINLTVLKQPRTEFPEGRRQDKRRGMTTACR
jgi:hypothetical protein